MQIVCWVNVVLAWKFCEDPSRNYGDIAGGRSATYKQTDKQRYRGHKQNLFKDC